MKTFGIVHLDDFLFEKEVNEGLRPASMRDYRQSFRLLLDNKCARERFFVLSFYQYYLLKKYIMLDKIDSSELFEELQYCLDKNFSLQQALLYLYVLYGDLNEEVVSVK